MLKFEGLKIRAARSRLSLTSGVPVVGKPPQSQLAVTSSWFALPALDQDSKSRLSAVAEAEKSMKSALDAAAMAGAEALELKATDIPTVAPVAPNKNRTPQCASPQETKDARVLAAQGLQRAMVQTKKDEAQIANRTKAVAFFEACWKYDQAFDDKKKKRFVRRGADGKQSSETLLAFDADIHIKEYRDRPVAEFFGNLLSDETTRTGLTTALVNGIDPATRAAKDAAKEAADLKTRGEFETALVAAETAIVAYSTAKDEEKATKLIDMESKKRAANRLAEDLGIAMPYPASGTWLTLSAG